MFVLLILSARTYHNRILVNAEEGSNTKLKERKKTGNALVSLLIGVIVVVVVVVVVFNRTSLLSSVTEFKLKCTLPQNIFSLK